MTLPTPYYDRERITIYHGDALDIMRHIPSESVAVVMTDPPYSSGARQSAQMRSRGSMRRSTGDHGNDKWIGGDNMTAHGFAMMVRLFAVEAFRVAEVGAHFFSFIDWRQWPVLAGAVESAGWTLRACLVWDKEHFGMGNGFRQQAEFILHGSKGVADNFIRHDLGTVFRHARHKQDIHPTMKPEHILKEMLSAVPDGVVLDPFSGSATTLMAARDLGRKAIGCEISEEYCRVSVARLSQQLLPFGGDA